MTNFFRQIPPVVFYHRSRDQQEFAHHRAANARVVDSSPTHRLDVVAHRAFAVEKRRGAHVEYASNMCAAAFGETGSLVDAFSRIELFGENTGRGREFVAGVVAQVAQFRGQGRGGNPLESFYRHYCLGLRGKFFVLGHFPIDVVADFFDFFFQVSDGFLDVIARVWAKGFAEAVFPCCKVGEIGFSEAREIAQLLFGWRALRFGLWGVGCGEQSERRRVDAIGFVAHSDAFGKRLGSFGIHDDRAGESVSLERMHEAARDLSGGLYYDAFALTGLGTFPKPFRQLRDAFGRLGAKRDGCVWEFAPAAYVGVFGSERDVKGVLRQVDADVKFSRGFTHGSISFSRKCFRPFHLVNANWRRDRRPFLIPSEVFPEAIGFPAGSSSRSSCLSRRSGGTSPPPGNSPSPFYSKWGRFRYSRGNEAGVPKPL